jgi:hypothetical protein
VLKPAARIFVVARRRLIDAIEAQVLDRNDLSRVGGHWTLRSLALGTTPRGLVQFRYREAIL